MIIAMAFFLWCNDTALAAAIRDSVWLFPVIEVFHLIGLAALAGAVLLVDLRLIGVGLQGVPVSRLARAARPWLLASLVLTIVSGVLLFVSEPLKCYENPAFWLKLACLTAALVFTALVRPRFTRDTSSTGTRIGGRLAGLASVLLWTGVAGPGRGIGFW
jgi:hypothetical protein